MGVRRTDRRTSAAAAPSGVDWSPYVPLVNTFVKFKPVSQYVTSYEAIVFASSEMRKKKVFPERVFKKVP